MSHDFEYHHRASQHRPDVYRGIAPSTKPRFRRYLVGALPLAAVHLIAERLAQAGYQVELLGGQVRSEQLDLQVMHKFDLTYVTTGEDALLDAVVDRVYFDLQQTHPELTVRCSDCYSHFTPPKYLLDVPRASASCHFSHSRKPAHMVYPKRPEESLFQ